MAKVVPAKDRAARGKGDEPKGHLLIVEDHVDARLVMEDFLESRGYATSITKTVDEALALLRSSLRYDCVLLDLMLPGRGGLQLLEELRAGSGPLKKLPVIVVSAYAPPEVQGANAVLHKPVDLNVLLSTIEKILGAHRR